MVSRDPYAVCLDIARAHYENFPVASRLLPSPMRPHVAAVYAFARIADDFADEGTTPPDRRHQLLDAWEQRLREAVAGRAVAGSEQERAIFEAVRRTIEDCDLPVPLFTDLLSAFRQDVDVTRYATWNDLIDYCRRSANPVGRLVLRISGRTDPALDTSSDALCTGLQLANFWQDVERDWAKGRVYLPREIMAAHDARERDIARGTISEPLRSALADAVTRTRAFFERGRFVCEQVSGRLGLELRATWLGGSRILDRLEHAKFDVFRARPSLGLRDALPLSARLAWWSLRGSPRHEAVP